MTYMHHLNWAILLAIVAITAAARLYFVLEHKHVKKPSLLIGAAIGTLVLAVLMAPEPVQIAEVEEGHREQLQQEVFQIVQSRCASCHSSNPTDEVFTFAQGGVSLDTMTEIVQWAPRIKARAIDNNDMPFLNKTEMTDQERQILATWIADLQK